MQLAIAPGWNCPQPPNPLLGLSRLQRGQGGNANPEYGSKCVRAHVCAHACTRGRVRVCARACYACMCEHRVCVGVSEPLHTRHKPISSQSPTTEQRVETWSAEGDIGKEGAASLGRPAWDPPRSGDCWWPRGRGKARYRGPTHLSGGLHLGWVLSALPSKASRGTFSPGLPVPAGVSTRVNQPSTQTTGIKNPCCPQGMWGGRVT